MAVRVQWYKGAYYIFTNHHGRRKAKKVGRSLKDAKVLAAKLEVRLAARDLGFAPAGVSFKEFAESWVEKLGEGLKPTSVRFYRQHANGYLIPALGAVPMSEFRREHCTRLIRDLREKGVPRPTIRAACRTLSVLLSAAVEEGYFDTNPALRLGKHLRLDAGVVEHVHPLTAEESYVLLKTAAKDPRMHLFILTALRTGLRLGELLALQWGDIDLTAKALWVRRAAALGRLGTPKNHQQRRVDLSTQLVAALTEFLNNISAPQGGDWVFPGQTAGMADESRTRKDFARICRHSGIVRRVRFHDLRHTYASLLLQRGASIVYVKTQMGHSSIKLTVDTYGHLVPGDQRATVDLLDTVEEPEVVNPVASVP